MDGLSKPQKVLLRLLSVLVTLSLLVDAENLRQLLGHDKENGAAGDTSEPTFAPSDGGNCFWTNEIEIYLQPFVGTHYSLAVFSPAFHTLC
jgi:hypothetical protein